MANAIWTEKGLGDVKLMLHRSTNRTRLVMRKEKTPTIIANQLVQPEATLVPAASEADTKARAFVFEAEDFADGVMRKETFALRFKEEVAADDFKRLYGEAQERNRRVFAESASAKRAAEAGGAAASSAASPSPLGGDRLGDVVVTSDPTLSHSPSYAPDAGSSAGDDAAKPGMGWGVPLFVLAAAVVAGVYLSGRDAGAKRARWEVLLAAFKSGAEAAGKAVAKKV